MKVALTVWEDRISPLFDAASMLLVTEIIDGNIGKRDLVIVHDGAICKSVLKLNDMGVDTLICGGISEFYANIVEARGIKIIPFTAGYIDDVLDAYIKGRIYNKNYRMPGCESNNYNSF